MNDETRIVRERLYEDLAAKSGRHRCRCGVCSQCQQNARWDRIFQAKFADPDYCSRLPRWDSTLNW